MAQINLLISRVLDGLPTPRAPFTGIVITVRDGYTPMAADDERCHGRPVSVRVQMGTRWDARAVNNLGKSGASVVDLDAPAVESAVAMLRAVWGEMPVQDNSGRFQHLVTP